MTTKILSAIEEFESARTKAHEVRCSDGNCVFRDHSKQIGMQTNGGCHCLDQIEFDKRRVIKAMFANKAILFTQALKKSCVALEFYVKHQDLTAMLTILIHAHGIMA